MPRPASHLLGCLALCLIATGSACGADDAPKPVAGSQKPGSDTSLIYRFDPINQSYTPIARKDLKTHHVYVRHSPQLGKWVWSKYAPDGTLRFAFGPGSSQPAALFDMPASTEDRNKALEKQSPQLAKRLVISGAKPSLRLTEDGKWTLMPDSTRGRVYDLETGTRWEWHGWNVVPVTHGTGTNQWTYTGGRYRPIGGEPRFSIPPSYQW